MSCVRDVSGLRRDVRTLRRCACAFRLARMCGESERLSEARTAPRSRPNVWRQWRAQRSGASPLHAGVRLTLRFLPEALMARKAQWLSALGGPDGAFEAERGDMTLENGILAEVGKRELHGRA